MSEPERWNAAGCPKAPTMSSSLTRKLERSRRSGPAARRGPRAAFYLGHLARPPMGIFTEKGRLVLVESTIAPRVESRLRLGGHPPRDLPRSGGPSRCAYTCPSTLSRNDPGLLSKNDPPLFWRGPTTATSRSRHRV